MSKWSSESQMLQNRAKLASTCFCLSNTCSVVCCSWFCFFKVCAYFVKNDVAVCFCNLSTLSERKHAVFVDEKNNPQANLSMKNHAYSRLILKPVIFLTECHHLTKDTSRKCVSTFFFSLKLIFLALFRFPTCLYFSPHSSIPPPLSASSRGTPELPVNIR